MIKIVAFFSLLCLLCSGISYFYFYYQIQIFTQPYIQIFSPHQGEDRIAYQVQDLHCVQSSQSQQKIAQNTFHFAVWNIHKGLDNGWQSTLANLAQTADFLLLQEFSTQQPLSTLTPHLPYGVHVSSFAYQNQRSGVATFSAFAHEYSCSGMTNEPWIRIPKVATISRYPLSNGQHLLVVNVHLINFEWHLTHFKQQLEQIFLHIRTHSGPLVIAGDFNTWNEDRLNMVFEKIHENGLKSVDFTPDFRTRFRGYPLDHLFTRGLSMLEATTLETTSSDHNPLLIKLKLN